MSPHDYYWKLFLYQFLMHSYHGFQLLACCLFPAVEISYQTVKMYWHLIHHKTRWFLILLSQNNLTFTYTSYEYLFWFALLQFYKVFLHFSLVFQYNRIGKIWWNWMGIIEGYLKKIISWAAYFTYMWTI